MAETSTTSTNTTRYPAPICPSRTRIGWIGIGVMGQSMATHLLSSNYSLTLYSRNPTSPSTLSLLSLGAKLSPTLTHLATSSDIIFTMVSHPSDVQIIYLNSLLPSISPHTVLVDHTSSSPSLAKLIHTSALFKQCYSVDAPVSGGDIGARDGNLSIFAGGDVEVIDWLRPLFELMGRVSYMGSAGKGQSCKIGNQIAVGGSLVGLSEGLVFAGKGGLDKGKFLEAIRGGAAGSMAMELWGERMVGRDFRPGGFAEYMVKDLGMGEEEGVVLPGAGLAKQLFSGMVANGDGKMGTQGVVTVIERLNGIVEG